jgi:putative FmdB family regulatory protein
MPAYDFTCTNCGEIEIFKGMLDPNPVICPRCGHTELVRRFAPITKVMYGDHFVNGRKPKYGRHQNAEITPRST